MLGGMVAVVAMLHLVIEGLRDAGYCRFGWLPRGHLRLLGLLAIGVLVGAEVQRLVVGPEAVAGTVAVVVKGPGCGP